MASPAQPGSYGHRQQLWLLNTTSGSQIVVDRVQSVEPSFNIPSVDYYELGRKGKIGITQNPPEYRIAVEQNMVNSLELEYVLSGKGIAPAGAQTYTMGDILTYAGNLTAYVLGRNNDDTLMDEQEYTGCSVAELQYRFNIQGALMLGLTLVGKSGKLYKAASTIHTWGTLDDASFGGIPGKDARIYFTSGSTATDIGYRLQSFNIRAAFPNVFVRELGNRALAGTLSDNADVTVDFDLLKADTQPTEKFFTDQTTYYDYQNPVAAFDAYVRVFDPTAAEGVTVVRSFKIDNVKPVTHTPIRAQVRGLATARYSLTMSGEDVANSGGLTLSNRNL